MLKYLIWAVLMSLPVASACASETYKIDNAHTFENFKIDHLHFSMLYGQLTNTSGTIVMDRNGSDSSVDVTIKAASVYTGNKARDKHLRDMKGFFQVDHYPKIHYKSTKVTFKGTHQATVQGKLTMHGTTRPVTLHVQHIHCGKNPIEKNVYTCGFNATTVIKRSNYGMTAFLPMVGNHVHLMLEAEADRPLKQ